MSLGTTQPPIQLIPRFYSRGYNGHDVHLHPAPRVRTGGTLPLLFLYVVIPRTWPTLPLIAFSLLSSSFIKYRESETPLPKTQMKGNSHIERSSRHLV